MIDYRIRKTEVYTNKMGELVSMLDHTRAVTLQDLKNLDQQILDRVPEDGGNSISALLLHMAAIEYVHQVISFEERDLTEEEFAHWKTALELGIPAQKEIRNAPLDYYIAILESIREKTLKELKKRPDSWLDEEHKWENGIPYNQYYLWFHVMEDEINHRGQIRMMKRMMSNIERNRK